MSILKDLDPQYAKLHPEPSLLKPAAWMGAALIALGGGYWSATQSMTKPEAVEAAPSSTQESSGISTGAPAKKESLPDASLGNTKQSVTLNQRSTMAAATIREELPQKAMTDRQLVPAPSPESSTRSSLANTEPPGPAQNNPNRTSSTPTQTSRTTAKTENPKRKNPSTQSVAKNEKNQGGSGKKSSERDIDIISAIVR